MAAVRITSSLSIQDSELDFQFIRASGPGGQNVNKTSTAVQLKFNVRTSASLPEAVRSRLARLCGQRLTGDGVVVIEAKRHRTQQQNRKEAMERLVNLIERAAEKPRVRVKTRPSRSAKERRLGAKQSRGRTKAQRRSVSGSDD